MARSGRAGDPALASERGADFAQALLGDVDELRGRLAEVEERLDFAERLLAQAREADQLPGGAHR